MMLDSGSVKELFVKDTRKAPSDSEEDFEKRFIVDKDTLQASQSLFHIDTESLYGSEIYKNISALLKPEGCLFDDADKENRTRFGLETIIEEMHDQGEDIAYTSKSILHAQNSDLVYNEFDIDISAKEELQRLVSLILKSKNSLGISPTLSNKQQYEEERGIELEKKTNLMVEYIVNEIKNIRHFQNGIEQTENCKKSIQEIPGEGDHESYGVRRPNNPPDCLNNVQSHENHKIYSAHEIIPGDVSSKTEKYCENIKSPKYEKKHGNKKCMNVSVQKKQECFVKYNSIAIFNAICDQFKDYFILSKCKPNTGKIWNLSSNIGGMMEKVINLKNAIMVTAGFIFLMTFITVILYKSPKLVRAMMGRLKRRRTPFEIFCDKLFNIIHGIIP